jgi:hypothetical protein
MAPAPTGILTMPDSMTNAPERRGLRHLHPRHLRLVHRRRLVEALVVPLARAAELALGLTAFALLPVWPLVAAALARDASYAVRYRATLPQVVRHIRGAVRGRSVSRYIVQRLAPRPAAREQVSGACTHCGNCCLYGGCVYLAYDGEGRSMCRIYGGRLWKLLACGDYPASAREIRLYDCPSFSALPAPDAQARVIPIAAARAPQPTARRSARSRAGKR